MAKAHTLSVASSNAKQVTDLTQGSNIGWSFGTTSTLCPRHSTPLSLKVHAYAMSKNVCHFFLCAYASSRVLGHSLSSRATQSSWDINNSSWNRFHLRIGPFAGRFMKVPSWNRFLLRMTVGVHHTPQLDRYQCSPNVLL